MGREAVESWEEEPVWDLRKGSWKAAGSTGVSDGDEQRDQVGGGDVVAVVQSLNHA